MYGMDILRNSVGNAALMEVQDRAHPFSWYSLRSLWSQMASPPLIRT